MIEILHHLKDPKLWELWYSPYYGGNAGFISSTVVGHPIPEAPELKHPKKAPLLWTGSGSSRAAVLSMPSSGRAASGSWSLIRISCSKKVALILLMATVCSYQPCSGCNVSLLCRSSSLFLSFLHGSISDTTVLLLWGFPKIGDPNIAP